jgi:hypothetical protein
MSLWQHCQGLAGRIAWPSILLLLVTGCADLLGIEGATVEHRLGGHVRGLWEGADPVEVKLTVDGDEDADETIIPNNGFYEFARQFPRGTEYEITLVTPSSGHRCHIEKSGKRILVDVALDHDVKCTGPLSDIELSGTWRRDFDPTEYSQTFEVAGTDEDDVALTIRGHNVTHAKIGNIPVEIDRPTDPISLPSRMTKMELRLEATDGQSKKLFRTYELVFRRPAIVHEPRLGKNWFPEEAPDQLWLTR